MKITEVHTKAKSALIDAERRPMKQIFYHPSGLYAVGDPDDVINYLGPDSKWAELSMKELAERAESPDLIDAKQFAREV